MPGQILIIDAMSNRRIQLRAALRTASYSVDQAETQSEGVACIRTKVPDIVIVAHDLPGLKLQQFCKTLRRDPKTQQVAVMVAVPRENHSARICALNAGAADLVEFANDPQDLQARLRSVMRRKNGGEYTELSTRLSHGFGFAEAQKQFEAPFSIVFISDDGHLTRGVSAIRSGWSTCTLAVKEAQRREMTGTDVFVIHEGMSPTETLGLIGCLLSNPATRHSQILYISNAGAIGPKPSPLDVGAHDEVASGACADELHHRITRLAEAKRAADQARAELHSLGEKAYTDSLTGLSNRRLAEDVLCAHDRATQCGPVPLALLLADIDHFKTINDMHGHASGDDILRTVGQVMKSHLRSTDVVARYGGEEFLIALPHTGRQQAIAVADRLRTALSRESTTLTSGLVVSVTISVGVALSTRSAPQASPELLRAADAALYRAKRTGRNRTEIACADDYQPRQIPSVPVSLAATDGSDGQDP